MTLDDAFGGRAAARDERRVETAITESMGRALEDLARLVALQSVADGAHEESLSATADEVVALFGDVGVADVRRVPTDDGTDSVLGHSAGPEGAPTVVAEGLDNAGVAQRLFISSKTASVHVSNILAKLGATSRTQAASMALRQGLITVEPEEPS